MKKFYALSLLLVLAFSCSTKDDSPSTDDEQMDDQQDDIPQNPFRLVKIIVTNAIGEAVTTDLSYNQENQIIKETYTYATGDMYIVDYFYDGENITKVDVTPGSEYNYFYTENVITSSNRIHPQFQQDFTYNYDSSGNLTIREQYSADILVCTINFEYDGNGNNTTGDSSCGTAIIARTYNTRINPLKLLFNDAYDKVQFISNNNLTSYFYETSNVDWDRTYTYSYNDDDLVSVRTKIENGEIYGTDEYFYEEQ